MVKIKTIRFLGKEFCCLDFPFSVFVLSWKLIKGSIYKSSQEGKEAVTKVRKVRIYA